MSSNLVVYIPLYCKKGAVCPTIQAWPTLPLLINSQWYVSAPVGYTSFHRRQPIPVQTLETTMMMSNDEKLKWWHGIPMTNSFQMTIFNGRYRYLLNKLPTTMSQMVCPSGIQDVIYCCACCDISTCALYTSTCRAGHECTFAPTPPLHTITPSSPPRKHPTISNPSSPWTYLSYPLIKDRWIRFWTVIFEHVYTLQYLQMGKHTLKVVSSVSYIVIDSPFFLKPVLRTLVNRASEGCDGETSIHVISKYFSS